LALEGNLIDFSLEDMFRLLAAGNKTGTLYMSQADAEGKICFKKGRVFFASSNWNRESLGRRLVNADVISEKQLRQALGLQKIQKKEKANRRLGQILVDEGYLDGKVLENFIQDQINDTLFDLFRWEEGDLRFVPDEVCEGEDIGISVSVENAIMESARRMELWGKIRQKISGSDTRFIMASAPGDKSMEIHLKPKEWMLLCYMHSGRSVGELVELTGYNDFETSKILFGMYSAGLIEKDDASDEEMVTEQT